MQEYRHTVAAQDLADAVQALLDAAPAGLSPELRAGLEQAVGRARGQVPPHLFFAAVEQAPLAISITDPEASILYVNPAFEHVTGYARAEVMGSNESLLSDKSTPTQLYRELWQTLLGQRSWSGKLVNRRKDGERYLAELVIAPVLDEGGTTRHYLGIHRDVTDLHRLEYRVGNQSRRIEAMVQAAPMPIVLVDEAGGVVLDNGAHRTLAAEMGQEPALALLAGLQPDHWARSDADAIAFRDQEVSFETDRGELRWFSCSGTWIREMDDRASAFFVQESRRYLLLVAQEITYLKQQQEEVRRNALRALVAEEALVHGLRETISAAEFQLQGPFNMLKATVGMLQRRGEEHNGPVIEALRHALAAGQEALTLLRNAMPRQQREPAVRINLNQLMRDVLSLATERMLALGVQVDWRPAARLPVVIGYENRLRALFKELFDNALDAMDTPLVKRRELRVATGALEDAVRVVIEDSGPGIPDELRLKVFEPLFSTKEHAGSAGMGLAMVQEVVKCHQGTLALERGDEGGCRVHLQLPLRATQHALGEEVS